MELFVDDAPRARVVDDVKLPAGATKALRTYAALRKRADEEDRRREPKSELSKVREQAWSLLWRHEPTIDDKAIRRQNRRQVGRRIEPRRALEERVVVVKHSVERRR